MDVMTEHGDFYSLVLAAWLDEKGDLRFACPSKDDPNCTCYSQRITRGWKPVYTLNPGKREPLGRTLPIPVTPGNVPDISTLAPPGQLPAKPE